MDTSTNYKTLHHAKRLHKNAMKKKFNITSKEFDHIIKIGFRFEEKSGWFVKESDDASTKDYLIIKETGFHLEHESYISDDGDGNSYTDYDKTYPNKDIAESRTLIQFLTWYYE